MNRLKITLRVAGMLLALGALYLLSYAPVFTYCNMDYGWHIVDERATRRLEIANLAYYPINALFENGLMPKWVDGYMEWWFHLWKVRFESMKQTKSASVVSPE